MEVKVNTTGFANDLTTFKGKDDVLTLMIHLGYLAYDSESKSVRIPNEEIKQEFQRSIHEVKHTATIKRLEESQLPRPIKGTGLAKGLNPSQFRDLQLAQLVLASQPKGCASSLRFCMRPSVQRTAAASPGN